MLTSRIGRDLGSVKYRVVRRIAGRQPKRREEGGWEYPPMTAAIEEAEFEDIGD